MHTARSRIHSGVTINGDPMYDPLDVLRISLLPKIGPSRGRTLLRAFGSFAALRGATSDEILRLGGFNDILAGQVRAALRDMRVLDAIEGQIERAQRLSDRYSIRLMTFEDPDYPSLLHALFDAPLYLFIRGSLRAEDTRAVAVVGTRAPTDYGRHAAEAIVGVLADQGVCIVSGLAVGIDTAVHRAAVAAGTRTIAVLGSGTANIYPSSNIELALRITEQGCLLSELPVDAKPEAVHFPRRNRIISGMTRATVLVESGSEGGAVLTAKLALDQNREVYAVPGSIFSKRSEGAHLLIRTGRAHLLARPTQLFEDLPELGGPERVRPPAPQLTLQEALVFAAIGDVPLHIDDLAARTGISLQELLVVLLQLEFRAVVRQLPGKHFMRA
jgi:DNA processing protein